MESFNLKGLNAILELCLIQCPEQNALFAFLIEYLGFNSVIYRICLAFSIKCLTKDDFYFLNN